MSTAAPREPLVSVVLPTYNRAHLLPDAMRSVLEQTWANLELVVVDDNSPDDTAGVVAAFDDPRIRYTRNDPNLRLPRTLNRGFALARGDYLTWTSDDNLFAPTAIERMVARLREGGCDFVYADYYQFAEVDDAGRPRDVEHRRLPGRLQLAQGNHIGACFLYTRALYEATGEYDPDLFLVEDYDYWMRAAARFAFCHLPEPLYYFRRDEHTLFCSRFCEVKSADILARVKNGVIDDEAAVDVVVRLLMADMRNLNSGLLKATHAAVAGRSWRLTELHREWTARYLRARVRPALAGLLARYRAGDTRFGAARDELSTLMQRLATIAYFEPAELPQ